MSNNVAAKPSTDKPSTDRVADLRPRVEDSLNSQYFLGVRVDNLWCRQALDRVNQMIENYETGQRSNQIFFVNVHSIFLSRRDELLNSLINRADMVLGDGSGLEIAGRMLNQPLRENLNGTDFIPKVCALAEKQQWSVYLLGARDEVVVQCRENLQKRYPHLQIAGHHHGYFDKSKETEIIERINSTCPDILLVGMGSPLQEKWISRNADRLDVPVSFAVGGLFDFIAQVVQRAPEWMRKWGIEWVYRFVQQPKGKWDRVFVEIPLFIPLVFVRQLLPQKFKSLFQI